MKQLLSFIICLVIISSCRVVDRKPTSPEDLKLEAKEFSLSIVQTYFSEDCDKFYNAMSDSLLVMDGYGIVPKTMIKGHFCQSLKKAIINKEKTFEDYLEKYSIEILTHEEIETKYSMTLPEYFKPEDQNYFFIGAGLKEGVDDSEDFTWDDMFIFVIGKKNQIWKITGVSG
ncbi:hypothetical protein E1176_07095 [Fulvivirga sp. RKSG066]|uniref:hypothetical protein n=1 Tax=Fulvivirga aurantia TaxID=2529383 RepID=UPI0012BD50C1|nr:hypothetical protein [Fulvivirga aurantia]MTI20780.1 hypothetical protein [Fulvivirga aurantia]